MIVSCNGFNSVTNIWSFKILSSFKHDFGSWKQHSQRLVTYCTKSCLSISCKKFSALNTHDIKTSGNLLIFLWFYIIFAVVDNKHFSLKISANPKFAHLSEHLLLPSLWIPIFWIRHFWSIAIQTSITSVLFNLSIILPERFIAILCWSALFPARLRRGFDRTTLSSETGDETVTQTSQSRILSDFLHPPSIRIILLGFPTTEVVDEYDETHKCKQTGYEGEALVL